MPDLEAYRAAGAVAGSAVLDALRIDVFEAFDDTAENGPTSLVKPYSGNAHKGCRDSPYFQEKCGHDNWRWRRRPCDKWACDACREYRVKMELVPEILRAIGHAWAIGETLKHVTLTGAADDTVTEASPEGAEAMRLKLAHFVQAQRRQGRVFEYLRVAETHKSGRVHLHLLVVMPYVAQREMEKQWGARVWVSAVGLRCPRCFPGRGADAQAKRQSTIVPPPGKGSCANCGYTVDWSIESGNVQAVAEIAAFEMSKYLTKEASVGGIKKKMNRSRGWAKLFQVKPETMPVFCEECGDEHAFSFVGPSDRLEMDYPGISAAATAQVAYYPHRGQPCNCWKETSWAGSLSSRASSGLVDMALFRLGFKVTPDSGAALDCRPS